jgi:enoyl-CoA hydratase/carnithine racemase
MGHDWILYGIDVFERLAALPQPVIAAVSAHALGGGLELAKAADLRLAVKSAKFGAPDAAIIRGTYADTRGNIGQSSATPSRECTLKSEG